MTKGQRFCRLPVPVQGSSVSRQGASDFPLFVINEDDWKVLKHTGNGLLALYVQCPCALTRGGKSFGAGCCDQQLWCVSCRMGGCQMITGCALRRENWLTGEAWTRSVKKAAICHRCRDLCRGVCGLVGLCLGSSKCELVSLNIL